MPCDKYNLGDDAVAVVCSRGSRAKPCSVAGCGRRSTKLCDFPLTGAKEGKTCDRPLCDAHARTQRPNAVAVAPGITREDTVDYCPAHDELVRGGKDSPKGAEAGVGREAQLSLGGDRREGEGAARPTAEGRAASSSRSDAVGHGPAGASASPPNRRITFAIPPAAPVKACRSCGARVIWIVTANGRRMPVEADGEKRGESHFAHCAQAEMWRGGSR